MIDIDPDKEEAIKAIVSEVERAKQKFPWWPKDPVHAASIVAEEAGELVKAALRLTYEEGTYIALYEEAQQVGAMAVRFLQHFEQYKESPSIKLLEHCPSENLADSE